ncbi:MAG: GspE/PulE family protein [Planctomycetota bacterium]|jgi:type IV pilus assembly protein PilB
MVLKKQQEVSGESLVGILEKSNLVDENQAGKIIAVSNKIEFVNLSPDMINPMAAHLVSYDIANKNSIIPISKNGNDLTVAMTEPWDIGVKNQIAMRVGCNVVPVVATPSAIRQAIKYHFNVRNITRQTITSMRLKQKTKKKNKLKHGTKFAQADNPTTKLVSSIIIGAINAGASDIHIEPQEPDMKVRYRIDGLLREAINIPSSVQLELISHIKVQAEMDISERRAPQDGHITQEHNGHKFDLRISSQPIVDGEKIVIRILDQNVDKWSLNKVVTLPDDNQKFRTLATNPHGMLLLTGPTGCGKTSTLYSILQLLNTPEKNIVTVEDPVEYHLKGISQIQVNQKAGVTFASALRNILRQDPDIILIGEIRDSETAEIAVSAALTGHLVLSTLHTNDAVGAISRLISLGVPPFLVASVLLGTIAQRLIRTNCPKCKQPYTPSSEEFELLSASSEKDENVQLFKGTGCDYCGQTGHYGRKSIYEILSVSPEIRKMITESASDNAIMQQAIKDSMRTLCQSGIKEVINGTTTLEELKRFIEIE